ncbi:MAG: DUF2608 domain-containing protein [Cellvibrionales bacterium]|nr:DUF2608 domain-containing protein [Cellvibrionales bacterium]
MLNIILFALAIGCLFIEASNKALIQVDQENISQLIDTQVLKQKDLSNTLILLDVDDTLITHKPGTTLGSSTHYYALTDMLIHDKKYNKKQAIDAIDPLLIEIHKRIPVIVTDEAIPATIKKLRTKGATVFGFTARGNILLTTTLEQLTQLGIQFSPISSATLFLKNGLFTVGQSTSKGEAAVALLNELKDSDFSQIIFLDDKEEHLFSVEKALHGRFKPQQTLFVHVNVPPFKFNPAKANQELCDFIEEHQNESAFKAFFGTNTFAQDVWRDCNNYSASSSNKY